MEILMATFTKDDIAAALGTPAQVSRAIEILGNNQRDDELAARSTKVQNGVGFTSCWASAGTALWQFVTGWDARARRNRWGRKCLSHPNWQRAKIIRRKVHNNDCANAVELGRKIALHHWRQLQEILPAQPALASMQTPAPAPQPEVQADFEMIAVPADKVDMAIGILKAAGIL
jgi:hypothetical protein